MNVIPSMLRSCNGIALPQVFQSLRQSLLFYGGVDVSGMITGSATTKDWATG